jgi:uncharacterized protein
MSNVEIIEQVYEAFATEGLDCVLELCDPHCVVTQDDALPWGGRHQGLDGVATFAAALGGTIHSVIATGATFDMPEVHVWTLRDGKVTAAEFYIETPTMLAALSSGVS